MASLRTIINNKAGTGLPETNLEQGQIFLFTPGLENVSSFGFCWIPPGTGTAVIEVWGASGSGSLMCCCGGGLPGNPGAYSKKRISVTASCFVCGSVGLSCGNAATLGYRGRSTFTSVCWTGSGTNGCICAEGGIAGTSLCSTGTSMYCCYLAGNFCGTVIGTGCGIICNIGTGAPAGCCAQAYGGDTNCFGGFSCAHWLSQTPSNPCSSQYYVAVSPGVIAENGAVIGYSVEQTSDFAQNSGQGIHQFTAVLSGAGRSPSQGVPYSACWASGTACGCYEAHGCMLLMPPGVPGLPPHPCTSVRDHAIRGGHGAVRIKFTT